MRARAGVGRLRELMVAGLVDSFGLALGWTLFSLLAVTRGGLAAAALYKAAMLVGVVLSAPVTTWLARRLSGRVLLTGTALGELVLRVGTLVGLFLGWSAPLIAVGVVVMHVAAFAGFAAMRAEVAAVDGRPRTMTRYVLGIATVEAAGASLAAFLPDLPPGALLPVIVLYGASLLPTIAAATRATVTSTPAPSGGVGLRAGSAVQWSTVGLMAGGAVVMLLGSGPTLLSVALADELYGRAAVAGAAVAFTIGCLLASVAVELVGRLRLPATLSWPMWGVGMVLGWLVAPYHLVGLLAAQFVAGMSLTAFEGTMDARVARTAGTSSVTTVLAWSASTRALGSAAAVRLLPLLVATPAIGLASVAAAAMLAVIGMTAWTLMRLWYRRMAVVGPAGSPVVAEPTGS